MSPLRFVHSSTSGTTLQSSPTLPHHASFRPPSIAEDSLDESFYSCLSSSTPEGADAFSDPFQSSGGSGDGDTFYLGSSTESRKSNRAVNEPGKAGQIRLEEDTAGGRRGGAVCTGLTLTVATERAGKGSVPRPPPPHRLLGAFTGPGTDTLCLL